MKRFKIIALIIFAAALLSIGFFRADSFAEIIRQPQSNVFPEESLISYNCESDDPDAVYRWYLRYKDVDYDLNSSEVYDAPWLLFAAEGLGSDPNGKGYYFDCVSKDLSGAVVYCVVNESGTEVRSQEAVIMISDYDAPKSPNLTVPASISCETGEKVFVRCVIDSEEDTSYVYTWYECGENRQAPVSKISSTGSDDPAKLLFEREEPGDYYFYVTVESSKDGKSALSLSSVIKVTVTEKAPTEEPTATPTPGPTAEPSKEPTASPTGSSATPEVTPTPTPGGQTTATPENHETATPTAAPTASPSPDPTATSDVTPQPTQGEEPTTDPSPAVSGTDDPETPTDYPIELPTRAPGDDIRSFFEKNSFTIIAAAVLVVLLIVIIIIVRNASGNDKKSKGKKSSGKKSTGKKNSKKSSGSSGGSKAKKKK